MPDTNSSPAAAPVRQIANQLVFPAEHAPYVDWTKIGRTRAELAAQLDVRETAADLTFTFFWENPPV
jgi:hypothetical protein